jgi:tRNA-dihydrouridine synthase A
MPDLDITINGGIMTLDEAGGHLALVDGVMLGRAAYKNPYVLAWVDRRFYGACDSEPDRHAVVRRMLPYIDAECSRGTPLHAITRHMTGLFQGQRGGRAWRRQLSEFAHKRGSGPDVVEAALARIGPAHVAAEAAE